MYTSYKNYIENVCRQLADVTKDGSLSLAEFNVAMHLVVLRKNNIPLPDVLPASLMPSVCSPHVSSPTLSNAESTSSPHRGKEVSLCIKCQNSNFLVVSIAMFFAHLVHYKYFLSFGVACFL